MNTRTGRTCEQPLSSARTPSDHRVTTRTSSRSLPSSLVLIPRHTAHKGYHCTRRVLIQAADWTFVNTDVRRWRRLEIWLHPLENRSRHPVPQLEIYTPNGRKMNRRSTWVVQVGHLLNANNPSATIWLLYTGCCCWYSFGGDVNKAARTVCCRQVLGAWLVDLSDTWDAWNRLCPTG